MSDLVIVESPAKAKTIKMYLGKNYSVVASMGHLRDLPKSQFGVDVEHDFEPKYISIRGKGELISKLKKEAKSAKHVYLATDPDREGEAISWHLAKLLDMDEKAPVRVTFNEITKNAVKNGIKQPRVIDMDLVNAQQARRVLDRIVGYKLSPVLWHSVKKGLSAGRVQSVATRLTVDREREINAFVPQEYWLIDAIYPGSTAKKQFRARFFGNADGKVELKNEEQTLGVLETIKNSPHVVSSVKNGEKQRMPSPPFITSSLQQEASRRLNFNARRTMSVAQELYEGINVSGRGMMGLITYMRTDSLRIAAEAQDAARAYIAREYGENYVPKKPRVYRTKKNAQDAHEAIRPSDVELTPESIRSSLSNDQYRLYKLIWDHFVASQMENAIYNTVSVDIDAGGWILRANGQNVKFKGFTVLYEENGDDKGEAPEKDIPPLAQGEVLAPKGIEHEQKFTQPPARYTEATLIRALEDNGIGRPSTYAPTITTILSRGYVVREGRSLKPTALGEVTCDLLTEHFKKIVDVGFTAEMESDLDDVEEGKRDWVETIREFYTDFDRSLKTAEEKLGDVRIKMEDEPSDVVCELCGRTMVYKMGRFGKFLACPGFPECRNTKSLTTPTDHKCPKCGSAVLIKTTRSGKKYYGCEKNPTCDFMTWDEPTEDKCPQCGSILLKRVRWGKTTYYCYNNDCSYGKNETKPSAKKSAAKKGTSSAARGRADKK